MINMILRALLHVQLPFEDPTVLNTKRLSVLVQRLAQEQLDGMSAQLENSSFTLPSPFNIQNAGLNPDNVSHIDVQVLRRLFRCPGTS